MGGGGKRRSNRAYDSEAFLTSARRHEQAVLVLALAVPLPGGRNLALRFGGPGAGGRERQLAVYLNQFAVPRTGGVERGEFVGGGDELAEEQAGEHQQRTAAEQPSPKLATL
jgi:hypothetical protein